MATSELKLINSVCVKKDINVVMAQNVDEMFAGYPDVWGFIKEYYTKYRAIPDVSILEEKFNYFEPVEVPAETEFYMNSLREEYLRNRLEDITLRLKTNTGVMGSKDVIQKSITALMKLSQYSESSVDIDITDFDNAEEHYAHVRERAALMGGTPGIPTGIDFIDSAYTSGLSGGDLIVLLGWTGKGKSLLSTMICVNAFNKGFKPMIVSLEMSVEKVRDRAYTMMGNGLLKNSDLAMGDIAEDDFRQWHKKVSKGKGFVVVSHDGVSEITPAIIQSKIDQHKPDIIVIDYAQLTSDNANSADMTARMRNMSKEYKRMAVANDIPIILISSATPDSSASMAAPPIVEQVAWSKQLAYDADLAIAVHKHDGFSQAILEVVCRKNRNGELFSGYFKADINAGIYQTFYSLEDMAEM